MRKNGEVPHFPDETSRNCWSCAGLCLVSAAQESDTTFKVDVKLVNVFVTVTDERGAPIAALKKDNFELREDGKAQKIAVFDKESALPLSIVLAIDTSLSTRKDLPLELASARRFAHAILRPVDALSLYQFSETVNELTSFTSDLRVIDRAIDHIRLGSATALYDALFLGSKLWSPAGTQGDGGDHRRRRHDEQSELSGGGARRRNRRSHPVQHHRCAY